MLEIASASINTFGISPKADFVPPSEESVFVLTSGQLKELITQAVEKSIQPLQDRISSIEDRTAALEEENAAMHLKLTSLETTQEEEISRVCVDIAYDRQRLAKLEKVEPQPLQRDRGEILLALLAANGGKMLAKDARQKLRMDKGNFSRLLDTLEDYIEKKPLHHDKRNLVLKLVVHN